MDINLTRKTNCIVTQFPDGQQNVTIDYKAGGYGYGALPIHINIQSRLNNWLDLERIVCAVKAVRNSGSNIEISLYIPYFLGGRSDRLFDNYSTHYLKDVICPIINSLEVTVHILDPHSDVLSSLLNKVIVEPSWHFNYLLSELEYDAILCPDAGAAKRIDALNLSKDVIYCTKHRSKDGSISRTEIHGDVEKKSCVIIDDICDGGKTFTELANVFKREHGNKLYLAVTHGIFSKGFDLFYDFEGIFCTNSYRDIHEDDLKFKKPTVTQHKVI